MMSTLLAINTGTITSPVTNHTKNILTLRPDRVKRIRNPSSLNNSSNQNANNKNNNS